MLLLTDAFVVQLSLFHLNGFPEAVSMVKKDCDLSVLLRLADLRLSASPASSLAGPTGLLRDLLWRRQQDGSLCSLRRLLGLHIAPPAARGRQPGVSRGRRHGLVVRYIQSNSNRLCLCTLCSLYRRGRDRLKSLSTTPDADAIVVRIPLTTTNTALHNTATFLSGRLAGILKKAHNRYCTTGSVVCCLRCSLLSSRFATCRTLTRGEHGARQTPRTPASVKVLSDPATWALPAGHASVPRNGRTTASSPIQVHLLTGGTSKTLEELPEGRGLR